MMNVTPRTQSFTCPCCKGFIGEAAPIEMVMDGISRGQQKAILEVLARRVGRSVAKESLLAVLFEERSDGGPDSADQIFNVQIHHLRRTVLQYGWTILRTGGGRSGDSAYRLIPTEVAQ